MTFKDFIKAKDEAVAFNDECANAEAVAETVLEKAKAAHAAASETLAAAHKTIVELLTEKGHYSLYDEAGALCIYQANADSPTGWSYYQPIPGESA